MKKCKECSEYRHCRNSAVSWVFFTIGLIATLAVRLVAVLMDYNALYAKVAWYIGVAGFFVFFLYKFTNERSRARTITKERLVDKVRFGRPLSREDYGTIGDILCSLSSNKDRINYFFIFATSIITFAFAAYLDFFRR